jgi:GNAT superfamily N-acetyltransferase
MSRECVTEPYTLPHQTGALEEHPAWASTDLSSLRCVFGKSAFARHPSVRGDTTWMMPVGYGLSETCAFFFTHWWHTPREVTKQSMGKLLPGNQLRVVDPDTGVALGVGEEGELAIKGPTLMKRYLGRAPEDCVDADGFFHTGDAGHVDADGVPVGMVGQWECEGGEAGMAAAHALLEMAVAWLRDNGARRIVGPIDFSTWYGYRFRDGAGDGRDPHLLEPVTADHAIAQWERFGFVRDETYFSAEIADPREQMEASDALVKELVGQGWRIRQLRMREWDELIGQAHAMSMDEFRRQPYFTPITLEDFRKMYEPFRTGVDPRYVLTAWSPEGEFAGYVFGVRDLGRAQRALQAGGIRGKVAALREAWSADTIMVKTICVAKPFRQFGISIFLQAPLYRTALDTGHTRICNMLMHGNNRSRMLTELAGGQEFRSYVTMKLDA